MAKIFFAGFKAGSRRYELAIDQENEDTYVSEVDSDPVVYRTNRGGWVYNKHNAIAGRFLKQESGNWSYVSMGETLRVNTKLPDRFAAEVDVFSTILAFGYRE